jgi:magnesium transporter
MPKLSTPSTLIMSTDKLVAILEKQRLIDGMVKKQNMPNNARIESVIHKQHDAELQNYFASHSSNEIAKSLELLSLEDAQLAWPRVPSHRQNEILWEMSNDRREYLAGDRVPDFESTKVSVFELNEGRLKQIPIHSRNDLETVKPIWIDLLNTSKAERAFIGAHFSLELPDPLEETELEVSSRFFIAPNDAIHLHSNFLLDRLGEARSISVLFILHGGIIFSIRDEELPVFKLQKRRALTQPGYVTDCVDVLLDLYAADVECSADSLESIYATLNSVGKAVLNESVSDDQAAITLANIAEEEAENGRIRGNILDTQRALNFLLRARVLKDSQIEEAKQVMRNIESLNSHTAFLFDKINFLMDATIGFININQNKRVNQLTVFSVVFMPINILAGMGGMSEFSMMTQGIEWPYAYAGFALASILIGYVTYVCLKHFEKRKITKASVRSS